MKCFVLFPDEVCLHPVKSFELLSVGVYIDESKKRVMDTVVKKMP